MLKNAENIQKIRIVFGRNPHLVDEWALSASAGRRLLLGQLPVRFDPPPDGDGQHIQPASGVDFIKPFWPEVTDET
jgi:hypothetical protein